MKAMLLAAGRGTRLKPLTDSRPKPLVTVKKKTLIEYNIDRIIQAGISEIIINVSYLADQIQNFLGNGARYGVQIHYSLEKDIPMGTGGGILNALPLLGAAPFLLCSADIWFDFDLQQLQLSDDDDAHLLLVENPSYHEGDYGLTNGGKITLQSEKYTFGGVALLRPSLFENCKVAVKTLAPIFENAIYAGKASGTLFRGSWFNVGTVLELERLRSSL